LAVRHRLAPSARHDDVAEIARSVVGLHATDPATVVLSALARMRSPDPAAVERAIYDQRSVVRLMGMRRTLFTVAVPDVPVVQAAAGDAVGAAERKRLVKLVEEANVAEDGERWVRAASEAALAAIDALGEAFAQDLGAAVPELATRVTISPGKSYEATVSLASRLVVVLAAEGHLMRGDVRGGWTSGQHRWTRPRTWLGTEPDRLPAAAARAELARAWLARFGPATVADLKWWTGWTLGATRAALAALDTDDVDLDGEPGLVLAGDTEPTEAPAPWVALLPSLDPTIMGWTQRDWYLGEHRALLFDRYGNAGPSVWVDGRAVGAWIQRRDGELVVRVLEDIGAERTALVDVEVARLAEVLGETVVAPRFHSTLSRELAA
jgi:hypothetical protein